MVKIAQEPEEEKVTIGLHVFIKGGGGLYQLKNNLGAAWSLIADAACRRRLTDLIASESNKGNGL